MDSNEWSPVFEALRRVGVTLKHTFGELKPLIERDDMIAGFRRIDGEATGELKASLAEAYPDVGWLEGELKGAEAWHPAQTGSYWVCDAIDGAVQYLRAIPQWCMSLTLMRDGQAVFAAIFDVVHGELFHAVAGQGAFLNGQPIRVNARGDYDSGVLATSQPPFINDDPDVIGLAGTSLARVLRKAGAVRNLGPTSLQLAYVACGRLDAFWEFGEDTFNCLGGALLVRAAGGAATDVEGETYRLRSTSIVAGGSRVHGLLRDDLLPA